MNTDKNSNLAANGSDMVTSDDKRKSRHHNLRLRVVDISLLCIIVLAGVTIGTYKLVETFHSSNDSSDSKGTESARENQKPLTTREKINVLSSKGDYKKAQQLAGSKADQASKPEVKAGWYTKQYSLAMDQKKYDKAVSYALEAYKVSPTYSTAYGVAQAYEKLPDPNMAKQYLQLAIDKLDKSAPSYQFLRSQYNEEMVGIK